GWQNEWHRPRKPRPEPFPSLDIAEVLRATGVTLARPEGAWDADLFWAPMLVGRRGRERAYFPRMALWADGPSGALLGLHVADPAKFALEAPLRLLESIARHGRPPATLRVRSDEARRLFEPLAAATGMRIVRARRLPALQAIEAEMAERLLVSTSPE
ncbi:MAG: hypothetical protein QJR08_02735, partial [Bacillota bacterium]|nr:hypothetical protein [Bacillota bacterium]